MSGLNEVPVPRVTVHVVPPTVPTTGAPFHERATHTDALGMPVAFSKLDDWPYHPTPCCGAAASCDETATMYCKRCYAEVDPAFGNHPLEPYRPIEEAHDDSHSH